MTQPVGKSTPPCQKTKPPQSVNTHSVLAVHFLNVATWLAELRGNVIFSQSVASSEEIMLKRLNAKSYQHRLPLDAAACTWTDTAATPAVTEKAQGQQNSRTAGSKNSSDTTFRVERFFGGIFLVQILKSALAKLTALLIVTHTHTHTHTHTRMHAHIHTHVHIMLFLSLSLSPPSLSLSIT